ncbi:MAG: hypothetical protein AAGD07_11830 [Planctomycetota bacterium]
MKNTSRRWVATRSPRSLLCRVGLMLTIGLFARPVVWSADAVDVILVVGAPGETQYGALFQQAAERWQSWARDQSLPCLWIGPNESETPDTTEGTTTLSSSEGTEPASEPKESLELSDRELLKSTLEESLAVNTSPGSVPLWVVLMGHGTFRNAEARFNLVGPDVSANELSVWCAKTRRPLVVINGASASGPFIPALSGENRVIVTATRDGQEDNFARFFDAISKTLQSETADLDHDDAISVLEAFVAANQSVEEFYRLDDRLATEHALIDDNGDRLGTPAESIKRAFHSDGPVDVKWDGSFAAKQILTEFGQHAALTIEQREQREKWESELATLRAKKATLEEGEYFQRLERILVPLALLYADAESERDSKANRTR